MALAAKALSRFVEHIQENAVDSTGEPIASRNEAESVASTILVSLLADPIFSQVMTEALDRERFERIG